jgi:hypothetical protein
MKITDEHRARMHELHGQGLSNRAIAHEIGCYNSTVGYILNPAYRERKLASQERWVEDNPEQSLACILVAHAKIRAKDNNVPFDPTFLDDMGDCPTNCPVCHVKMERGNGKQQANSPTVDRIIPELGYVPGNVQWLCLSCNVCKHDRPMSYLVDRRAA